MNSEVSRVATKTWPMLSAPWINARVDNVLNRLEAIFDHLVDDGWLASNYLPYEEKMTPKIERQLAEQIGAAVEGRETMEQESPELELQ